MSRFSNTKTSPHFLFAEFWKKNPSKLKLTSDGLFKIPEEFIDKKIEYIQNSLPNLPEPFRDKEPDFNEKLRLRYTVVVIGWVFPFLQFECEMVEGGICCGLTKEGVITDPSLEDYHNFCGGFIYQFTLLSLENRCLPLLGVETDIVIRESEIQLLLSAIEAFLNKNFEKQIQKTQNDNS